MFKVSAEPTAPQGFKSIDWSDSSKAAADITANFAAVEGHFKSLAGEVTEGKRCSAEVREMATKAAADLTAIDRGVAELRARANIGSVDAQTGPDSMLRSFVLADSAGERLNLFTREVNYRGVQIKVPGLLDSPENYGELHTEVKRLLLGAYVHAAANAQRHENPRNLETMRRLIQQRRGRVRSGRDPHARLRPRREVRSEAAARHRLDPPAGHDRRKRRPCLHDRQHPPLPVRRIHQ